MLKRKTGNADVDANIVDLDDRLQKVERAELQRGRFLADVSLPNATAVRIRHHLARVPLGFLEAGMSGAVAAGYINVTSKDVDFLTLTATGFGATIVLSMWVF